MSLPVGVGGLCGVGWFVGCVVLLLCGIFDFLVCVWVVLVCVVCVAVGVVLLYGR